MWKISEFDMNYINEVIKDTKFPQISKAINITNKEYLVKILKEINFIKKINFKFTQYDTFIFFLNNLF